LVASLRDLHHWESVSIEMTAQRRQDAIDVDADHEAQLAARPGARRHRVDGIFGIASCHCQDLEAAPSEHFLGQRETGLTPARIDDRIARAGSHLTIRK